MTVNELQKVIDYVNTNLTRHDVNMYNEETNSYDIYPSAYFNEVLQVLSEYPIEESEPTCSPNYEAMYNDMVTKLEAHKAEIKGLKNEILILNRNIACAKGAIAMVETIYGRKWSPMNLEGIR